LSLKATCNHKQKLVKKTVFGIMLRTTCASKNERRLDGDFVVVEVERHVGAVARRQTVVAPGVRRGQVAPALQPEAAAQAAVQRQVAQRRRLTRA